MLKRRIKAACKALGCTPAWQPLEGGHVRAKIVLDSREKMQQAKTLFHRKKDLHVEAVTYPEGSFEGILMV